MMHPVKPVFTTWIMDILSILGHGSSEMSAVDLIKTYCSVYQLFCMDVKYGLCLIVVSTELVLCGTIVLGEFFSVVRESVC